jgi:antitoxin MazE
LECTNFRLGEFIMITQLRRRAQVTLPSEVVKKMKLREGDNLDIAMEEDRIIIKPVLVIDRSQSWFWSKKWQELEKVVDEEIKQGRVHKAKGVEELVKKLDL